jgi:serine/threonine protein kinase
MTCLVLQPGYQPIPGYTLKDKLGSGGYGEVWSADAPGGLTKAIKFVFGSIDDQRGSTELRSLNRIRKLNHPFLLSIERVEIVDGQLVIVTELAQGSLHDRFLEYREKGYIGIPQERLLRYMADAADGLDYLCQEHGLQHLDVKPGNLLLVADRVKVADFGLIKNLQSVTQSVRNGLTPVYAAPEMFDGRPSPSSDQYSLAVAYVELLSGKVPFRGRTFAHLANEHLNKVPNLESVPVIERPVLAKALAKKPIMRFGTCREFVRALEDCQLEKRSSPPKAKSRIAVGNARDGRKSQTTARDNHTEDGRDNASTQSAPRDTKQHSSEPLPLRLLPPLPLLAPGDKPMSQKVLYIGVGGTGGSAVQLLRMRHEQSSSTETLGASPHILYIDTDGESVEQLTSPRNLHAIPYDDTLTIRLKSSQYFRQCTSPDISRISRRWIFNIPRTHKTEGVRPLGMLAFLDHASECYETLTRSIEKLFEDQKDEAPLKVYLMASAHGGTGSAIVTELGYLIRQAAASMDISVEVQIMLLCASASERPTTGLEVASAIACLEEIAAHRESGGLHEPLQAIPQNGAMDQIPFDQVTLLYGGVLGLEKDWIQAIENMVDYVRSQEQTDLGQRLAIARLSTQDQSVETDPTQDLTWLRIVGFRRLNFTSQTDNVGLANRGCLDAFKNWINLIKKQISDTEFLELNRNSKTETPSEEAWTSALLRGQQLTASSWVRRVIAALAPLDYKPLLTSSETGAPVLKEPIAIDWVLSDDETEDIDAIAVQLNYDPEKARNAIYELMSASIYQLWYWMDQSALNSLFGWKHLGMITGQLEKRLNANTESINELAKQLIGKRESILEKLYQSKAVRIPDADLMLETLSLEIRFHTLAAKLNDKLSKKLRDIRSRWLKHSLRMLAELTDITSQLLTELGLQQTGLEDDDEISGLILNPFYCDAIRFLRDFSYSKLSDCWTLPAEIRRKVPPECKDLRELFRFVTSNSAPDGSNSAVDANSLIRMKNNSNDNNFFKDRFGWNSIFRTNKSIDQASDAFGSEESNETSHAINSNLAEEFRRTVPKLLKCGGSVRNILMIGSRIESSLQPTHFQQITKCQATTISDPVANRCSIFSIGEQVDLDELIRNGWTTTSNLQELARKLRVTNARD